MKSPNIDKMMASIETPSHPGHKRHHPASHHWAVAVLAIVTSILLFVVLIISVGTRVQAPIFSPSSQPLSTEAAMTASGVASDFSEVTASDLGPSVLAP